MIEYNFDICFEQEKSNCYIILSDIMKKYKNIKKYNCDSSERKSDGKMIYTYEFSCHSTDILWSMCTDIIDTNILYINFIHKDDEISDKTVDTDSDDEHYLVEYYDSSSDSNSDSINYDYSDSNNSDNSYNVDNVNNINNIDHSNFDVNDKKEILIDDNDKLNNDKLNEDGDSIDNGQIYESKYRYYEFSEKYKKKYDSVKNILKGFDKDLNGYLTYNNNDN